MHKVKISGCIPGIVAITFLSVLSCSMSLYGSDTAKMESHEKSSIDYLNLENCDWSAQGGNEYFILEPGYQLTLEGMDDEDTARLVITVLNDTELVDGVMTRVIEERESVNGQLVEISRNFFALCKNNESIFYFGEDVDIYRGGKIVGHEGAWRAGTNNNRPGLMMPGMAVTGTKYFQENAPDMAMDQARIVTLDTTLETPAGKFENCLVVEETTSLEPDALEYKIYAPGIGLIKDENLLLTKYGYNSSE
jgi:hypothetical protein